jgi:hypothetical protein
VSFSEQTVFHSDPEKILGTLLLSLHNLSPHSVFNPAIVSSPWRGESKSDWKLGRFEDQERWQELRNESNNGRKLDFIE